MIMISCFIDATTIELMQSESAQKAYQRAMQIREDYNNGIFNNHYEARIMQIYHQDGFDHWIDLGTVLGASEQLLMYIKKKGAIAPLAGKNAEGKPVLALVFAKRKIIIDG